MPVLPFDPGVGGGVGGGGTIYPLWQSNSSGGSYAINDQINFAGNSYRNLTGTNTDTDPSADSVNWVRVQIVTLTQAEFDLLTPEPDIFYNISDAAPLRIEAVFIVADIAARDALSTQQEGDTARVLDNGAGQPEMFVWDSASWLDYTTPSASYLSAGMLVKPGSTITGAQNDQLNIDSTGFAHLYVSTDPAALIRRHPVPAKTIDMSVIANGDTAQVIVRPNAGAFEYFLNPVNTKIKEREEALAVTISNLGGDYEVDFLDHASSASNRIIERFLNTDRIKLFQQDSLDVTVPFPGSTTQINISGARLYNIIADKTLAAVNTVANDTLLFDDAGGSFNVTGFNNSQYVDVGGTGLLTTLTSNRYTVNWVHRALSDEADTARIVIQLGSGDHTLSTAQAEVKPGYDLNFAEEALELVGKIIVQQGSLTPVSVQGVVGGFLAGISSIITDATLTGDGTSGNPLSVVGGGSFLGSFDANGATYPSPDPAAAFSADGEPIVVYEKDENQRAHWRDRATATYSGGFTVDIDWRADTATTGNVTLGVRFKRQAPGDNTARSFAAQKTETVTTALVAGDVTRTSIIFTESEADNIAALDNFTFEVQRVSGDTMTDNAQVTKIGIR